MDYYDIMNKKGRSPIVLPALLPDRLWGRVAPARRSRQLSPLYIQRYRGPRKNSPLGDHDFWELTFIFHGQGVLDSPTPINLNPNRAVLIPPGFPHAEQSSGLLDALWVGLAGTLLDSLPTEQLIHVASEQLYLLAEQVWNLSLCGYADIGPELDGLICTMVSRIFRLAKEQSSTGDLIDDIAIYLDHEYARPISMTELAARIGFSEGYFYRAFKTRTGQTPVQYLTEVRICKAIQLLQQSSLPIAKVARLVGYADPLYFSRVFKRHTGKSPRKLA